MQVCNIFQTIRDGIRWSGRPFRLKSSSNSPFSHGDQNGLGLRVFEDRKIVAGLIGIIEGTLPAVFENVRCSDQISQQLTSV